MNSQSAEGFRKAYGIFEQHAEDLLSIDLSIKGKPMHADLLRLLSLGPDYDDPNALNLMADRLPSMLVFYGIALMEAEAEQASIEEEMDLFIQSKWQSVLETLVQGIDGLKAADGVGKIPASLKPAPTQAGIRSAIINSNKAMWDDLTARKTAAVRQVKTMSNIFKGIEQRIRLLGNQLGVTNSMVLKGIGR